MAPSAKNSRKRQRTAHSSPDSSRQPDPVFIFAQRYEAFFNSTTDAILVFNTDLEILDANPRMLALTGYTYDELVFHSLNEIFDGVSTEVLTETVQNMLNSTGDAGVREVTLLNRRDNKKVCELHLNLLSGQYGHDRSFLALIRDISRRKAAEQELIRRAEELQRVFDAVPSLLFVIDERKRIRRVNSSAAAALGKREKELLGGRIGEVLECENHYRSKRGCGVGALCKHCALHESLLRGLKAGQEVLGAEESLRRRGSPDQPSYYRINVIPMDAGGRPRAVLSLEDITDRKKSEMEAMRLQDSITRANIELKETLENLARSQSQLVESQKLEQIGLLASGLAHNLKTPLGGIKGYAQLLTMDQGETRELKMILEEVDLMTSIIENLMLKSRMDHNADKDFINLNELLNIELTFLMANLFFKHQVKRTVELAEDLPELYGVYTHFSQAVMNIITNALDAMHDSDEKKLCIRTRYDERWIYVDIEDTGCGIPESIREEIFNPFFTTKPGPNEIESNEPFGTGLGLSSANYFLRQYGGSIHIDSEVGKGSTVTLQIPYNLEGDDSGISVLIVDDLPSMVDVLINVCQQMGMRAFGTTSGEEAFDLYQKENPDIVVSDLCIPGKSGPQLVSEIRKSTPSQYVIYITGYSDNPEYKSWLSQQMRDARHNAVLKKPFPLDEFKKVMQRMTYLLRQEG